MDTDLMAGGEQIMSNNYANVTVKESGAATGLRITFAIIMVVTFGIFTNCIVLQNTVLNKDFWRKTVKSEEIQEVVKDELNSYVKDYLISQTVTVPGAEDIDVSLEDAYNLETGDEFTDQLIDYTLDELLDMVLEGDTSLDEDRFNEIFDEYGEDFFDELEQSGVSKEEFLQNKDELFDQLNSTMEEVEEATKETDTFEMIDIKSYQKQNTVTMIITGILNLIMIVVLIIIHKNKFKPVRATGIAITVTEVISLIGWLMIWGFFQATRTAVDPEIGGELVEMLLKAAIKSIQQVMGIVGIACGIGIVLIIAGCVGAGIVTSALKKKAANNPVVAAPVQYQYAPAAPVPVAPAPVAPVAAPAAVPAPVEGWTCPNCGKAGITGLFCNNCGTKKTEEAPDPQPVAWDCPNCGNMGITSNFCNNCGTKRP